MFPDPRRKPERAPCWRLSFYFDHLQGVVSSTDSFTAALKRLLSYFAEQAMLVRIELASMIFIVVLGAMSCLQPSQDRGRNERTPSAWLCY